MKEGPQTCISNPAGVCHCHHCCLLADLLPDCGLTWRKLVWCCFSLRRLSSSALDLDLIRSPSSHIWNDKGNENRKYIYGMFNACTNSLIVTTKSATVYFPTLKNWRSAEINRGTIGCSYLPLNIKTSGHCTCCVLSCVAAASRETVRERKAGEEKGSEGLPHLRSLDVLICFSNKAALWGQVPLIWTNLKTAENPHCHK